MKRTWHCLAALTIAAAAGILEAADLTSDRAGNIFTAGETVQFRCDGAALPFRVENWQKEVVRTGVSSPGVRLEKLPPGYYTLHWENRQLAFAVVADPNPVPGGFFGIDSALSWIGRFGPEQGKTMFTEGADLARLLGVSIVRDRLSWNDTVSEWKQYRTCAELLRKRDLEVLSVFHDSPAGLRKENRTLPDDLRDIYAYAHRVAAELGSDLTALEFWNEQNADWFCYDPVWELAAAHKAAYLGIKAARPDLAVATGGLTEWFPKPLRYFDRFLASGTNDYFDAASFHLYGPLSEYPAYFAGLNAAFTRRGLVPKPLWITESGTHCDGYGMVDPIFRRDRPYPFKVSEEFFDRREHSFAQGRLVAEFLVKSSVTMQSLGAARNFPFVLLPYNERNNRKVWGFLTWDYQVTPEFVAYSNLCARLSALRCLGRLDTPPEIAAYLYESAAGEQTVVYWLCKGTVDEHILWQKYTPEELEHYDRSTANAEFALHLPQSGTLRSFDLMGGETPVASQSNLTLKAERFPKYLSGLRNLRPLHPTPVAAAAGPVNANTAIVLQLFPEDRTCITDQQSMTLELPAVFKLRVYNFSDRELAGKLTVNDEVTVMGLPESVTVPPNGRVELPIQLTSYRGKSVYGELRFGGNFNGRAISPLTAFALFKSRMTELYRVQKVDLDHGKRWKLSSSGKAELTPDGNISVDFSASGDDKWVYPILTLSEAERSGKLAAVSFSIRCEQREGEGFNNANLVLEDAAGVKSHLVIPNPTREWQSIHVILSDHTDALHGDAFHPAGLSIGFNPGSKYAAYQVKDLVIYSNEP